MSTNTTVEAQSDAHLPAARRAYVVPPFFSTGDIPSAQPPEGRLADEPSLEAERVGETTVASGPTDAWQASSPDGMGPTPATVQTPAIVVETSPWPATADLSTASTQAAEAYVPLHGRRALERAVYKAAKFQVQVALASSLDDRASVDAFSILQAVVQVPPRLVPVGKIHFPPTGRRARESAMRKAAKFRAEVDSELLASPLPADLSRTDVAPALSSTDADPAAFPVTENRRPAPTLHPVRAKKALSSPRGQRALELAMRKAAAARAASVSSAAVPVTFAPVASQIPAIRARRRLVPAWGLSRRWAMASWAFAAVALAAGVAGVLHYRYERLAVLPLAKPRPSLEWLRQAQDRADDGSFRLALDTVDRALVDSPDNPVLLKFKGDMYQSLFQFGDAQSAYEQALSINPRSPWVQENLVLSRRLNRSAKQPTARRSMLYGLHRAMMAQGRLGEAVAISNQLRSDPALAQSTWQAALDRTGLRGRVAVDDEGVMSLDLSGSARPDLTLIEKFPVRRLNLAGTGVDDLSPLREMSLEALDLSSTPVYDLSPLRGMPLAMLCIAHTGVVDLSPLEDCALRELDLSGTRVTGVEALAQLPLVTLRADDTPITDLNPLAALPVIRLSLSRTRVTDLRPLRNLGLEELNLDGTNVVDLTALRGSPLRTLSLSHTLVRDLTPLADLPLTVLNLQGCPNVKDLRPLLSCAELEHLFLPSDRVTLEALHRLPHLRFIEGGSDVPIPPVTNNEAKVRR